MQLSDLGEFGLIRRIRKKCFTTDRGIIANIGDDAAALKMTSCNLLVTSDMMIERIHFDLSFISYHQLGHKLLAVNISDIFAMGGSPKYFIVNIGVPASCDSEDIEALYSGIVRLARKWNIAVIGGDTCSSKHGLLLSGTLVGKADRVITRRGAKIGDGIFLTGTLGDSAMGLHLLQRQKKSVRKAAVKTFHSKLMKKHLLPDPAPLERRKNVTSMIDISDGLLVDLSHICDESRVGALIYKEKVPLSEELSRAARDMNVDAYEFALSGGEDYVLLFTASRDVQWRAFRIGEIVKKGYYVVDEKGNKIPVTIRGFEHFKRSNHRKDQTRLLKKRKHS